MWTGWLQSQSELVTSRLAVYLQSVRLGAKSLEDSRPETFFNWIFASSPFDDRIDLPLVNKLNLCVYILHIQHVIENASLCTVHKSSFSPGIAVQFKYLQIFSSWLQFVILNFSILLHSVVMTWFPQVRFPELPDFLRCSVSGTGSTQHREYN
jgi:hypothetical protein